MLFPSFGSRYGIQQDQTFSGDDSPSNHRFSETPRVVTVPNGGR